jgi:NADH-quinone oxidoreductase subunit M
MVILAAFQANFWYAFLAATTLILGAAYTLWMVKRVFFGEIANDEVAKLQDINSREMLLLASLAVIVLVIGIWPDPLLNVMHASVDNLLLQITQSKL